MKTYSYLLLAGLLTIAGASFAQLPQELPPMLPLSGLDEEELLPPPPPSVNRSAPSRINFLNYATADENQTAQTYTFRVTKNTDPESAPFLDTVGMLNPSAPDYDAVYRGTFAWALRSVNETAEGSSSNIIFDIDGADVIDQVYGFPAIWRKLYIDGTNLATNERVRINGATTAKSLIVFREKAASGSQVHNLHVSIGYIRPNANLLGTGIYFQNINDIVVNNCVFTQRVEAPRTRNRMVALQYGVDGATITNNTFGTNADGTELLGEYYWHGIDIWYNNRDIQIGNNKSDGNTIVNCQQGIQITGDRLPAVPCDDGQCVRIQGNRIGTGDGINLLGFNYYGIDLTAAVDEVGVLIGGSKAEEQGNTIFAYEVAVMFFKSSNTGTINQVDIYGNVIGQSNYTSVAVGGRYFDKSDPLIFNKGYAPVSDVQIGDRTNPDYANLIAGRKGVVLDTLYSRISVLGNSFISIPLDSTIISVPRREVQIVPPTITNVANGTISGTSAPNDIIEIYRISGDSVLYEASTAVNAAGDWTYTVNRSDQMSSYAAIAIDQEGNTSVFAPKIEVPVADASSIWLEAECATVGSNWQTVEDPDAAGGKYLVYPSGLSLNNSPSATADHIILSVETPTAGTYHLQARIRAPSGSSDSFWFKVDDGDWIKWWQDITRGNQFNWNTAPGSPFSLAAGSHTITVAYRESGTQLDKLYLSSSSVVPDGLGGGDDACAQPVAEIIIDNTDPGFSTTGSWPLSTQQSGNRYGPDYVHDGNTGKGSKAATFQASVAPGTYEVYGWWSASSNRATNVPYDVVDACGTTTTTINQRSNGASWQLLGTYTFEQTAQVTLRTDGTDGYVIADAVKLNLISTSGSSTADSIAVDNTGPGFSTTGSWKASTTTGPYYQSNYLHDDNTGKGNKTATFQATVNPGSYQVFAWWSADDNRASNVPFDIAHQAGTSTVVKNQRQQGGQWVTLGTYDFGTTAQVTIRTTGTDAYVMADGVLFVGGGSNATTPCSEEPYTPPTPPSLANNPPDGTTAPGVTGNRPPSQSNSNVNYVRSFTPREQYNQPSQVTMGTSVANVSVITEYLDGLGRPIQTVVRGGSGSAGQDLVQPVEYDEFGRQTKQRLPYAASGSSGGYQPNGVQNQYDFYTSAPDNVARSGYAYAETDFEASPLNRPVRQAAPGENWRLGSGREIEIDYLVNTSSEVQQWNAGNLTGTSLSAAGNYDAGALYKTVVTDENNYTTTEFRDKLNQVVLKRVQGPDGDMDTYYAYDDYNLLRFVIPPEASKQLQDNASLASSASFREQYLFVYEYDNRRRMVSEQMPGGGTTQMRYDQWDRLVYTQSALQDSRGEWSFTKYDVLNRPIMTGVTSSASLGGLRHELRTNGGFGYTLTLSSPSVSEASVRTVTYYDNYGFPHAEASLPSGARSSVRGQVTGTQTRNLEDNSGAASRWLKSVIYYDEQYRPIQTVADNHLGGTDRSTTQYRNAVNSEMLSSKRVHSSSSSPTRTITQNYQYDHAGRLTQATHQLDSEPAVVLSAQQYNAIGELVNKQLGNSQQAIDYRYNIRGWLTRINDLSQDDRFFNQELYYDFGFDKKQYNGNISGIRWNRAGGKAHAYGYTYDAANRITGADYRAKPIAGIWASSPGNFTVDKVGYDQNGNILNLKRYGEQDELLYLWDNLDYKYDGNRLRSVGELPEGQAEVGFVDGVAGSASVEYGYDASGNMTSDANKGISSITYDPVLNLPTEVVITDGSPTKTTDYVAGFHYTDGTLDFIQHDEGRLMVKDGLAYHYDLKDHLGNTRVTFSNVPMTTTATASMEASAAPVEEAVFGGVAESRQTLAFHNTTQASTSEPQPNKVATLKPGQQGPSKSVQVHAGDTVRLLVNARYETVPSQVQGLEGIATEVAGALQRTAAGLESGGASSGVNGLAAGGALATSQDQEVPKAYLNYLLYDENYKLIDQGFQRMSESVRVH